MCESADEAPTVGCARRRAPPTREPWDLRGQRPTRHPRRTRWSSRERPFNQLCLLDLVTRAHARRGGSRARSRNCSDLTAKGTGKLEREVTPCTLVLWLFLNPDDLGTGVRGE